MDVPAYDSAACRSSIKKMQIRQQRKRLVHL